MESNKTYFYPRYSTWFGHITFAILAIMAFAFFKERVLTLDASFQSFTVLKGDYSISANRFGAMMTLIFPIVAAKLGGSLKTVLIAYSLSFVLVHWFMFWLCNRVLKQPQMAFCIVLFNVLMINNTFFWAQNEGIQAISLGFVFWSLLLRRGSFKTFKWFDYPLLLSILVTLVYFHPLIIFPFVFIAAYFFLDFFTKTSNLKRQTSNLAPLSIPLILATIVAFIAIIIFKNTITPSSYDAGAMARLDVNNTLGFISKIAQVRSYSDLMAHLWTDFALFPIFLGALTIFYSIKKRFLKLLLLWLSTIVYTLIILISYRDGGDWFHVESQYLPMSIFVIVPFVWELIPALMNGNYTINSKNTLPMSRDKLSVFTLNKGLIITTIIIGIAILSRLIDIYQTRDFYKKRVDYMGELLEKTKKLEGTKFLIADKYIDKSRMMQTWCMGYETLYYSALQSPDSLRTIAAYPEQDITWQVGQTTTFQAMFNSVPYRELNPRLFHQIDTIRSYRLLTDKDLE